MNSIIEALLLQGSPDENPFLQRTTKTNPKANIENEVTMAQVAMKYAVHQGNRTIALFRRLRDARQLISEMNWEEGKINLRIVRL